MTAVINKSPNDGGDYITTSVKEQEDNKNNKMKYFKYLQGLKNYHFTILILANITKVGGFESEFLSFMQWAAKN